MWWHKALVKAAACDWAQATTARAEQTLTMLPAPQHQTTRRSRASPPAVMDGGCAGGCDDVQGVHTAALPHDRNRIRLSILEVESWLKGSVVLGALQNRMETQNVTCDLFTPHF